MPKRLAALHLASPVLARLSLLGALVAAAAPAALATGCRPKPPASPHCINNTTLQFKRIDERLARYKAGTRGRGDVYWSRSYLETARFVLTGKGIDGSGAQCTNADRDSKDHSKLLKQLKAHEKDVVWMETERGVAFAGAANNGLSWTWLKTSQPVSQDEANTL